MSNFDVVVCEIDVSAGLTLAAAKDAAWNLARLMRRFPDARVQFALPGFDDDLRELVDIPEARHFLRWMGEALVLYGDEPGDLITRLDYTHALILGVCMGTVPRSNYIVDPSA